jgi:hypothetical protein
VRNPLYRHGFVVAVRQTLAVICLGLAGIWLQQNVPDNSYPTAKNTEIPPRTGRLFRYELKLPMLAAFMLVGIGLLATSTRSAAGTAAAIARSARVMNPRNPNRVVDRLIALTGMAAFGCIAVALRDPPEVFFRLFDSQLENAFVSTVWSALLSIAFVFFAATSHAAYLSRHCRRD